MVMYFLAPITDRKGLITNSTTYVIGLIVDNIVDNTSFYIYMLQITHLSTGLIVDNTSFTRHIRLLAFSLIIQALRTLQIPQHILLHTGVIVHNPSASTDHPGYPILRKPGQQ